MHTNDSFIVVGLAGGSTLSGTIPVRGAKNAVLKALAASILFEDDVQLTNVPAIEDVSRMGELLAHAGALVRAEGPSVTITPSTAWRSELEPVIAGRLRASVVLTGPLLARTGEVSFPFPGGCVLGERPIDLFLSGFTQLGAEVVEENERFTVRAKGGVLKGAHIFFPSVSVTATETMMLAAVLAQGETVLQNAAMEPEIGALAAFLNSCGADIEGAGTPTIRVQGGSLLRAHGRTFRIPPDRIEAGSFVLFGALAGNDVTVTECEPAHMGALLSVLARAGVALETGKDFVRVREGGPYQAVSIRTHEYPGFPTDLQAPMAVFLSQANGEATLLETIFDGRFRYADDLSLMGADITVMNPHKILIKGPRTLTRKELEGPDLRGGLAYILAAAVAEGTSTIRNAYVIDRGYERIEERLQQIGLNIKREKA